MCDLTPTIAFRFISVSHWKTMNNWVYENVFLYSIFNSIKSMQQSEFQTTPTCTHTIPSLQPPPARPSLELSILRVLNRDASNTTAVDKLIRLDLTLRQGAEKRADALVVVLVQLAIVSEDVVSLDVDALRGVVDADGRVGEEDAEIVGELGVARADLAN